ncbi:pyridoxal-phosphate-dependent aminotransferase family protein [Candidatus Palauibacter sp.]|uniref:pyridoxal-phosphate-dependent aminotransferase family protein n=1 Tax=Candidatus Palauibacter sp. TaxID=3101350 RepID=UPI003AF2603D
MSSEISFGRFFLPGPTEVPPDLFDAMRRPVVGHRSPEVSRLIEEMQPAASRLFQTWRPVYLSTSSATGMMEAAITNLTRRRALCLTNGSFSQRFHAIAGATGRPADTLEAKWGEPNLPDRLRTALSEAPGRYDLVTLVHSESSTGVLNPLEELAAVVREFDDVLIAVDTVSSLAGAPVRTDDWGLDFVLTGSQKAVALPPGLALAVASERALARAREVEHRGFYFDILKFEKNLERWQTPNTPAVSLLFALDRQLARMMEEGLEARWRRHDEMARRTYEWVERTAARTGQPWHVLAPEGYRSPCVTVIVLPDGLTGPEVASRARAHGYTVAAGYGPLKESSFRIGHMGEHTLDELEALLAVLDEVL